jgi:DNA (cytosine-5)-methyltransferase 1
MICTSIKYREAVEKISQSISSQKFDDIISEELDAAVSHWIMNGQSEVPFMRYHHRIFSERIMQSILEIGVESDRISESSYQALFKLDFSDIPYPPPNHPQFKFVDLFAGIGGFRQAMQSVGGKCVFSSEWDRFAKQTYYANYGEVPYGDITKIKEKWIPEHDVLCAGFPCQPFSHAGLKLGIDDIRGTLFFDIARIMKEKRPKIAFLENVRGLVSHDRGRTLKIILTTLMDMGYACSIDKDIIRSGDTAKIQQEARKMILRSYDFGVPQNRQRIYIVLWRDDMKIGFTYPKPLGLKTSVGDILEENPDPKFTISDRLWSGHQRRKKQNKENGKGFGYGLVNSNSKYTNTISARYYKDGSEILIAQQKKNPRKLTPREAARLQGFSDEFVINPSNVQAYKQFGNSVSVPVVKTLAKQIQLLLMKG